MKTVNAKVTYTVPKGFADEGQDIEVPIQYPDFEGDLDGAIDYWDKRKPNGAVSVLQQVIKEDIGNTAREAAKASNGHSSRVTASPEAKADKIAASLTPELIALLASKGIKVTKQ